MEDGISLCVARKSIVWYEEMIRRRIWEVLPQKRNHSESEGEKKNNAQFKICPSAKRRDVTQTQVTPFLRYIHTCSTSLSKLWASDLRREGEKGLFISTRLECSCCDCCCRPTSTDMNFEYLEISRKKKRKGQASYFSIYDSSLGQKPCAVI